LINSAAVILTVKNPAVTLGRGLVAALLCFALDFRPLLFLRRGEAIGEPLFDAFIYFVIVLLAAFPSGGFLVAYNLVPTIVTPAHAVLNFSIPNRFLGAEQFIVDFIRAIGVVLYDSI
jgi:hypothetical protein